MTETDFPDLVNFSENKLGMSAIVGGFEFRCKDRREAAHRLRRYLLHQIGKLHQWDTEEDARKQLDNLKTMLSEQGEIDVLRERVEALTAGLEEIKQLARWNGPAAAHHAMYAIWEAARKLVEK